MSTGDPDFWIACELKSNSLSEFRFGRTIRCSWLRSGANPGGTVMGPAEEIAAIMLRIGFEPSHGVFPNERRKPLRPVRVAKFGR